MIDEFFTSSWNEGSFTAQYSIPLGQLVEDGYDIGFDTVFKNTPLWNPDYAPRLKQIFISNFWFRELCVMEPARWRLMVLTKLNIITPYYNDLFKSNEIKYNPLYTMDYRTENEANHSAISDSLNDSLTQSDSTASQDDIAKSRSLFSDTPQLQLQGTEDYSRNITDSQTKNKAATDASASNINSASYTSSDASLDKFVSKSTGYNGVNPSQSIVQYRQSLINVESLWVSEFEEFFFGLWSININGI